LGLIARDNRLITRAELSKLNESVRRPAHPASVGLQQVFLRGEVQRNTVVGWIKAS
jgi:hypothetical protein